MKKKLRIPPRIGIKAASSEISRAYENLNKAFRLIEAYHKTGDCELLRCAQDYITHVNTVLLISAQTYIHDADDELSRRTESQ